MTWVDVAVLGVLAVSGLLAVLRGFVREVLGIAAWIGALALATWAEPVARAKVLQWLPHQPGLAQPLAFGGVFLVALIVLLLVSHAISKLVRQSALGGLDRILGLVFGIARGAALVVLAYILAQMVVPIESWPAPVLASRSLPFAYQGAAWAVAWLPPSYRPKLAPPPAHPGAPALGGSIPAVPRVSLPAAATQENTPK